MYFLKCMVMTMTALSDARLMKLTDGTARLCVSIYMFILINYKTPQIGAHLRF